MGTMLGGKVKNSSRREYGRGNLNILTKGSLFKVCHQNLLFGIPTGIAWQSYPKVLSRWLKQKIPILRPIENPSKKFFGLQFHPEVEHSEKGKDIIRKLSLYRLQMLRGLGYG
jgi:GMP synthase (glutamine-hydrolysing)